MTEQEITIALDELIDLVAHGKALEAYEKFYHQDIQKTDLDGVYSKAKKHLLKMELTHFKLLPKSEILAPSAKL